MSCSRSSFSFYRWLHGKTMGKYLGSKQPKGKTRGKYMESKQSKRKNHGLVPFIYYFIYYSSTIKTWSNQLNGWGYYSSPCPKLLALKQFQCWMLQYVLSFPSRILNGQIFPSYQIFADDSASKLSFPHLQYLLRNQLKMTLLI